MQEISIGELIDNSLKRTKAVLFDNFSIKKWLKLLFIAWLAGSLGNGGINFPYDKLDKENKDYKSTPYCIKSSPGRLKLMDSTSADAESRGNISCKLLKRYSSEKLRLIIAMATIIFLAIMVLFMWLTSRFRFIWLNAIIRNTSFVKEPFRHYRKEGNSLFKAFIALFIVFLVFIALIGLWVYSLGASSGIFDGGTNISLVKIFSIFLLPLFVFVILVIAFLIINTAINHFVIPIMAERGCLFLEGCRRFIDILRDNIKGFLLYLLVVAGLGVVSLVVISGIAIISGIVLILVGSVVFGLMYFIIAALLKAKIIYMICVMIVGVPYIIMILIVLYSISLPFAVFFRSFSLYFLSNLNCGYQPFLVKEAVNSA